MRTLMAQGQEAMEPTDPQQALRGTPELAVVLNFLHTFRTHLQLTGFTAVRHSQHSAARSARASARTGSDRTASCSSTRLPAATHRSAPACTSPASLSDAFVARVAH